MTVYLRHIPSTDPRLRRHIEHDDRSRDYEFDTSRLTIQSVVHERHIAILDQGKVGSCTANAGIGALATSPLWDKLPTGRGQYPLTEAGALALYSDEEVRDGDGPYPPNDNGSSGLTCAKCLLAKGEIAKYQHTFSLDAALKALTLYPILFGTNWYNQFFTPDADGRIRIGGDIAGGHEIVARQIDAENQRVWFDNSWGSDWGVDGRFYLTFEDFGTLLDEQGDVTVLIPLSQPAPPPPPAPPTPAPPAPPTGALEWLESLLAWLRKLFG